MVYEFVEDAELWLLPKLGRLVAHNHRESEDRDNAAETPGG
ncbi:hypothetical protein [Pseudoxanthomonas sp.]